MRVVLICLFGFNVFQSVFSQDSFSQKKEAVCIIGASLLNQKDEEIELNRIVRLLESHNYKVYKFYHPYDSWEQIKTVSLNASIFIYRGHGTNFGIDGGFGGIYIEECISGKRISTELKFYNNPIVLFPSVCGGAGSSAGDVTDIGIVEARSRVVGSSLPFFLAGAKAYYANNYKDGMLQFLELMFQGKSLEEAFDITGGQWTSIDLNEPIKDKRLNPIYKIGVSSSPGGENATITSTIDGVSTSRTIINPKNYPIAFAGDPSFKIK